MIRKSKLMPTHDCPPEVEGVCIGIAERRLNYQLFWTEARGRITVSWSHCDPKIHYGDRVRLTFHTSPGRAGWWEATKIEKEVV